MAWTDSDTTVDVMTGDQSDLTPSGVGFLNKLRKSKMAARVAGSPAEGQPAQADGQMNGAGVSANGMGSSDAIRPPASSDVIRPPASSDAIRPPAPFKSPSAAKDAKIAAPSSIPNPIQPDSLSSSPDLGSPSIKPNLAPQGSGNPFLHLLQRITGQVGAQPESGEQYTGPTTPEEKRAGLGQFFRNVSQIGAALRAGGGSVPQQAQAMQYIEEEPKLDLQRAVAINEMQHRQALERLGQERVGVSQEQAETAKGRLGVSGERAQVDAAKNWQKIQSDGSVRPYTADEILADPRANLDQQTKQIGNALKQAETELTQARATLAPLQFQQREREINARIGLLRQNLALRGQELSMRGLEGEWNYGLNPVTGERLGENPATTPSGMVANPQGGPVPYRQQTLYSPTVQMRNIGQQSKIASEGIPGVLNEIQTLAPKIGPIAGRWGEFIQGRVGLNDPEFAGLRSDLLMLASAVALAHARGRLPENLRQEFDATINAPQQDPANLIAVIGKIKPWMDRMAAEGDVSQFGGGAPHVGKPTKPKITLQ